MTFSGVSGHSIPPKMTWERGEHCIQPVSDLYVQIRGVCDRDDGGEHLPVADFKSNFAIDAPVDSAHHAALQPVPICRRSSLAFLSQRNKRRVDESDDPPPGRKSQFQGRVPRNDRRKAISGRHAKPNPDVDRGFLDIPQPYSGRYSGHSRERRGPRTICRQVLAIHPRRLHSICGSSVLREVRIPRFLSVSDWRDLSRASAIASNTCDKGWAWKEVVNRLNGVPDRLVAAASSPRGLGKAAVMHNRFEKDDAASAEKQASNRMESNMRVKIGIAHSSRQA